MPAASVIKAPERRRTVALLSDDTRRHAALQCEFRSKPGVEFVNAPSGLPGLVAVRRVRPALVLLELKILDEPAFSLLENILLLNTAAEVVVLTEDRSMESAVATSRRGVLDYVVEPFELDQIRDRIRAWMAASGLITPPAGMEQALWNAAASVGIAGRSRSILEAIAKAVTVGPHFRNALVTGPTGAGKELFAKLLHRASGRSGPFVLFNCAATPESLLESELFGHVKGAFTGAGQDRIGIAEQAQTGTLFIDEIGELSLPAQATLLRLVQNRESKRLGASAVRNLDIRIIAATNRDLRSMVNEKTFREDLYHRLSNMEISVPSLAERPEDIPLLAARFLDRFRTHYCRPLKVLTPAAQEALVAYQWPGNVRELESAMDYCCMMCTSDSIDVADLPEFVRPPDLEESRTLLSLEEMELRHLSTVLRLSGGNREETAEVLGIGRATLYRMLAKLKTAS